MTAEPTLNEKFKRLTDALIAAGEAYVRERSKALAAFAEALRTAPEPDPVRELRRDLGAEHQRLNHEVHGGGAP